VPEKKTSAVKHKSTWNYRSGWPNKLDTGLATLSIAKGDPFKLTSPAQHALRG